MQGNDYETLFAEIITKMDARDAAKLVAATPKPSKLARVSAIVKIAAVSGAILIAASLVFRQPQAARRTDFTVATGADGIDAIDPRGRKAGPARRNSRTAATTGV